MAITFKCPACKEQFQVEDKYGGRKWRCSSCSSDITIPDVGDVPVDRVTRDLPAERRPAPRYDDDDDRRPARRRRDEEDDYDRPERELSPSWGVVKAALRVLTVGVSIYLVAYAAYVLLLLIALLSPPQVGRFGVQGGGGLRDVAVAVGVVLFLSSIAVLVLWIVGQAMSCAVPSESGGKGLALGALICTVVSLLLLGLIFVVSISMAARGPFGGGPGAETAVMVVVMLILALVVALVGNILYLFFMRAVAAFFGKDALAINIVVYFIIQMVYLVGNVAFIFLASRAAANPFLRGNPFAFFQTGVVVMVVEIIGSVGLLVWFLILLTLTAGAIPKSMRRRRDYY